MHESSVKIWPLALRMSVVGELHMHGYAVNIRSTKTFQNAAT